MLYSRYLTIGNLLSAVLHIFIFVLVINSTGKKNISKFSEEYKQIITVDIVKIAKKTNIKIAASTDSSSNMIFANSDTTETIDAKESKIVVENNKTEKQSTNTIKTLLSDNKDNKKNFAAPVLPPVANKFTAPKLPNSKLQKEIKDELSDLLKNITTTNNKLANKQKNIMNSDGLKGYTDTTFDKKHELTIKIQDLLQSKFLSCWNMPVSAKGLQDMNIEIKISLLKDGSVTHAKVLDSIRYKEDNFFQVVTDSALRAINICSPIKELTDYDYDLWSEFTLIFDPGLFL
ncbi:hypothetical protein [Candidatus Xenohaliotis californiensis]